MRRLSTKERFEAKIKVMESGCHEWQSTMHWGGYGKMYLAGRQVPAHRAAWMIHRGEIPEGRWILHTCDNRRCVNPDHLYAGTPAQNAQDKVARFTGLWGKMLYGEEDHRRVHELRSAGMTQQAIAKETGFHQTTVSRILRGVGIVAKRIREN